jgi:hypothetical protein
MGALVMVPVTVGEGEGEMGVSDVSGGGEYISVLTTSLLPGTKNSLISSRYR